MLRAVELGGAPAGGFTGMFLAALGADVTRAILPGELADETPRERYRRAYLDRGKRPLPLAAVDAAAGDGSARAWDGSALHDVLTDADLLIDTLPPGGLAEHGLGMDHLHRLNPRLVVVSITPFGQDGPRAEWRATELIVQAMGGLLAASGDADQPPARLAGDQAAHVAGTVAAILALAAVRAARSGQAPGVHIDVSMQEALSTGWAREIGRYVYTGQGVSRADARAGLQGYPNTVMASDGWLFVFSQGKAWEGVAAVLGLHDFLTDEWCDEATRKARWDEVEPHFRAAVASRPRHEWFALAAEYGFTFASIEDARGVLDSPQLAARDYFERGEIDGREVAMPSLPFTFAGMQHPRSGAGRAEGERGAERPAGDGL